METEVLYEKIRYDFFQKVYSGEIKPYQQLLAERKQAEELSVSRGTIRKARQILVEEGFISNTQGSGAIYVPLCNQKSVKLDIVAVVVPVHNPFFMSYYRAFEKKAEENDVLVVIKQLDNYNADRLKDVLFSLFMKGIKDVVFWPYDTILEYQYIERLSGLGMNVVFFDNVHSFKYCDYVSVDNHHAIQSLYNYLKKRGSSRIAYIGWSHNSLTSNTERENSFLNLKTDNDVIIRIPWNKEELSIEQLNEFVGIEKLIKEKHIDGFLCGNGYIGITLSKYLLSSEMSRIPICSIDNFEESLALSLTVYEQPFKVMGEKTFQLLQNRHTQDIEWQSEISYLKGNTIER